MVDLPYTKARKALKKSLIDSHLAPEIMPEGVLGKIPDHPWCIFDFLPDEPEAVTLGQSGEDNHTGVFIITLQYPSNEGTAAIYSTADQLCDYYMIGSSYTYDEQLVMILSCAQSPIMRSFHGFRISLSVNWITRISRS